MIKSTKEFDSIVYETLTTLRDSESFRNYVENQRQDDDFGDILEHCIDNRYIDGLTVNRKGGFMISLESPRLTLKGLEFIEDYNN